MQPFTGKVRAFEDRVAGCGVSYVPRFQVTYQIRGKTYMFCIPAPNASHIWRSWDRPGAKLVSVVEVDENGSEI